MYIEYAARHATVRALEVMPVGSSERLFVVDGIGVIDAATFGALYQRNGHAEKAAPVKRQVKTAAKRAAKRAAEGTSRQEAPEVAIVSTGSAVIEQQPQRKPTLYDHITALVQKVGPLGSTEIFERLHKSGIACTPGSIYAACHEMKARGQMVTRVDDEDGRMKYHLVAA